ncbi:GATA-type zinc finger protein 1 isoform X3 [Ictidomys tridecemlineatus]
MLLGELLASRCLDVEPPRPSAQQKPRPPGCFRLSGRSLWPGCQDSITALGFLQETEEGLALPPTQDPLALGPCWGPMTLGTLDPLTMARNSKNMQTPVSQKRCSMVPPEGPPAPPQRRPRKQPHPCRGTEKGDPTFQGVTLTFELKPDCSLQILPTYSSHSQGPPASPASAPEPSPGGSEAQAPRCCASCRTQRTPLWRDAEDGTPLCNACGIRSSAWRRELGSGPPLVWGDLGRRGTLEENGFLMIVSGSLLYLLFLVADGHNSFILFIYFYVVLRIKPRAFLHC